MENFKERRSWARYSVEQAVSFKYCGLKGLDQNWYFGEARNISVNGMCIIAYAAQILCFNQVLLCFPQRLDFTPDKRDLEPLWIKADIIWKNFEDRIMGLSTEP